jgi:hypothetical protein
MRARFQSTDWRSAHGNATRTRGSGVGMIISVLHIAGQIIWYSFLGCMILGGCFEFREYQERLKHRTPNIGRRAASLSKRARQYHHHVAKTAPAIAVPIVAKPRSRREPVAADPARADVISALRNLGWPTRVATATYNKVTGTGFDEKLRNALALMASQPSLWSKS